MMDYIWFDDNTPILNQLPGNFKSAAILLNPFIQMPIGWEQIQQKNSYEHIYPSNLEIMKYGKPIMWKSVMQDSGFKNYKELAFVLKTSIWALRGVYEGPDLTKKIKHREGMYYPNADSVSVFLIEDFLKILSSKGAKYLNFSAPIDDKNGKKLISETTAFEINRITDKELILTDENLDFAFMSVYGSFMTIFLAVEENIDSIFKSMHWEGIICDNYTILNWYLL